MYFYFTYKINPLLYTRVILGPARVESDPAVDGSGDVKLECVVKEEPGFDLEPLMSNQVPSMFNGVPSMFNQGTSVFNPQSFMFNLGNIYL